MEYNKLIFVLTQLARETKDVKTQMQLLLTISDLEKNGITDETESESEQL